MNINRIDELKVHKITVEDDRGSSGEWIAMVHWSVRPNIVPGRIGSGNGATPDEAVDAALEVSCQ